MSRLLWCALLSCSLLTAGCQALLGIEDLGSRPDGGTPPPDDADPDVDAAPVPPDASSPEFSFAVLTVNATIPLGGTNVIEVEVLRRGGFAGEVRVMPMSPPTGIQIDTITIPPGQGRALIPVSAAAPLTLGDTVSFELVATADALPARMAAVNDAEITGKPGDYDLSFGPDATGYSAISYGADDDGAFFDLDVLPNGDVLALGWGTGGQGARRFALIRLGPGGQPDPDFNGGALVRTDFDTSSSGENAQAYAVGRQVDGRIIAMGGHSAGSSFPPDIALVRYSVAGAEGDPVFGNRANGKSRIDLGGDEEVTDGLVLPDSKILVVGQSGTQLFIARATPDGRLDTTFHAPTGFDIPNIGVQSGASAVIVDDRGRLLVAGFADDNANGRDMLVLRYTPDGQLDAAFGDQGVVRLGTPAAAERAAGIAVRPDGRIVVAGTSNGSGDDDFQLRQLMENGAPDRGFGQMGVSTPPTGPGSEVAEDMLLLPDGRVVIVGNAAGPVVARYTRAGTLDIYFGQGGVLTPYVGDSGSIQTIEQVSNSKVLIAGGNAGGTPGPGTFGIVVRMWM